MKITDLRVTPLRVPLSRTFGGSQYQVSTRCTIIVQIDTDEGISGQIYSGDERDLQAPLVKVIKQELRPLILGEDPLAYERIWEKLFHITLALRDRKLAMQAVSAVDIGIWDVIGKALKTPVYKLLGGYRDRLPIITIGGYYEEGKGLQELADEVRGYVDAGLAGLKLKVGGASVEEDIERTRVARQTAGSEFLIACDANQAWTPRDAIRFARAVGPLDIAWLEEPVQWQDQVRGMKMVRSSTVIPVTAGQSEISINGCRDLMAGEAIDICNVDVTSVGGITEWRRIAAIAHSYDVRMAHHEEPQIASHLLASAAHGLYVECFAHPLRDPVWQQLVANRPAVRDGAIVLPDGSGFGWELDQQFIDRYRVDR
jgi:D-galactarolactone cycloisomerase